MKKVETTNAPKPIGAYSQAIKHGDFMFCSGQIPLDPNTGEVVGETVEEQTKQVMENLKAVLASENLSFADVVKSEVFLSNINNFALFNKVYESYFESEPYPARYVVGGLQLPKGVLVEVAMVVKV